MKRAFLVLVISCAPAPAAQRPAETTSAPAPQPSPPAAPAPVPAAPESRLDRYRETVDKIVAAARADRGAYQKLAFLTDRIGNRMSGSAALDRAIEWATRTMKDDGHDVVREPVMVPHWVRGAETAELTAPLSLPLHVLGLGGTVGTPKAGITAPVIVIHDWAELDARRDAVKGAIVLYDVAMPAWTEDHAAAGYLEVVPYRLQGASRAAKYGAVAVLMRSVTSHSLSTPHTGAVLYEPGVAKIPALAITVEDSLRIARLAGVGPVAVHLRADDQLRPEVASANVIGELRGSERPDEIVVIGGHLDSWDVGQGAHDDGAGAVATMQALTTLRRLGIAPRRTIRAVLFTAEEFGIYGGRAYAATHAAELPRTVFALELDLGGYAPRGFTFETRPGAQDRVKARLTDMASLLRSIGELHVVEGQHDPDVSPMRAAGVPALGIDTEDHAYFDVYHSEADTLDKVDPAALADDVAVIAAMAYVAAEMPDRIDAP